MIDYRSLRLKVGLELHQQLDTKHKLFCGCPTILRDAEPDVKFLRKLRPTQSELGQVDEAALFEFKRGRKYLYESYNDIVCLVEMDEEPPHEVNEEALDIALEVALLLKAEPVGQVCVMRKEVIDGSNTTGFQRTMLIAVGGPSSLIEDEEGPVKIETICLEEDAARKMMEVGDTVHYRLDRLGIPLVEIATAPDIKTSEQAMRVALKIGRILRATGKVKRGLGTIRQDLNISIEGGARMEIKGVQELELLPKIIELEVVRQLNLIKIAEELKRRGVSPSSLNYNFKDVTEILHNTKSKLILEGVHKGGRVLAVKLPSFKGLLSMEVQQGRRFGRELKDYASFWGGVEGIIHTDELPNYGIEEVEVEALLKAFEAQDLDAIVLTVAPLDRAEEALRAVVNRARQAILGVPEETRSINPDCTTKYARPRPGAARMYPETDVRPITIDVEKLERIRRTLPELPEQKLKRYVEELKLNPELAEAIISSRRLEVFERAVSQLKVSPTVVASTLEYTLKGLKREGFPIDMLDDEVLMEVFRKLEEGSISKEAIPEVLKWLASNIGRSIDEALTSLGLRSMSIEELKQLVEKVVDENRELLIKRGTRAIKPLIGEVMKLARGRVDGKLVSEVVTKIVKEKLGEATS